MSTIYRERERDRYDDNRSVASTRTRDNGDGTYTKVTRYVIREDDDTRSNYTSRRRPSPERQTEEIRITRREEDDARSSYTSRRRASPERQTEEIRITRRDDDDTRSSYTSRRRPSPERQTEEIRITRRDVDDRDSVVATRTRVPSYVERDLVYRDRTEMSRSPRPTEKRDEDERSVVVKRTERDDVSRVERDRESVAVSRVEDRREEPRHGYEMFRGDDYDRNRDLQHYTRTAEYFSPPNQQQPQTIIIRQDPIIIRERVRDDDYQLVRKSDADEERSVATTRRDRDEPRDEEYFYEKKVRERYDEPKNEDFERRSRRELSPHDSISQVGRRRNSYSSDDSMVYVKRVEKDSYSRDSSPDKKKDLAAGAIAGIGAAELLRNHRKKEGKETSGGIGRIGRDVGAGAIGAIAAEGIRRYRSKSRRRSQSRGRSESPYSRGDRRARSRSSSDSHSKLKHLGALGLGAVAVAAAANFATKKMEEKKREQKEGRRSRSRRRRSSRGSVQSLSDLENDPEADDARNPSHRNSRMAAAGAIGAAGAALIERHRSKSRGRDGSRERSHSRIRQGLPIVAAGLGTAALAGLYEKNKAKREAENIQTKEKSRRRSRSGGRSRDTRSDAYYDDRARDGPDSYIEYGHGEVSGSNFGPEYYGRQPPQEPFYGEPGAVVPAGRTRSRSRSMSRDRRGRRDLSAGSDPEHGRHAAEAGLGGAAAGAFAASEHERRKQAKRERRSKSREQQHSAGRDPYEDSYGPQQATPQPPWSPQPPNDPYASQQGFGQFSNQQYPNQYPAPNQMPAGMPGNFQPQYQAPSPQPAANQYGPPPQSYTPQPYNPQAYQAPPPPQSAPPQQGYQPPYNQGGNQYGQPLNRGASDENVSAGRPSSQYTPSTNDQHHFVPPNGVNNSRSIDPNTAPFESSPTINIHPPTNASSTPNLDIPQTYVPPSERPDTPPADEKRVSFAPSPQPGSANLNVDPRHSATRDSDSTSPDSRRHRRKSHDTNRGYEASEDTDFSPNDNQSAARRGTSRDQSGDGNSSRRLNPEDNGYGRRRSGESRRDKRPSRAGSLRDQQRDREDSEDTIDLPARFDEKGQKKTERGDDPLADRIDDILKGKGAAGKVFGNFMDGLFGPEGRGKAGSGEGDAGNSGRRK